MWPQRLQAAATSRAHDRYGAAWDRLKRPHSRCLSRRSGRRDSSLALLVLVVPELTGAVGPHAPDVAFRVAAEIIPGAILRVERLGDDLRPGRLRPGKMGVD